MVDSSGYTSLLIGKWKIVKLEFEDGKLIDQHCMGFEFLEDHRGYGLDFEFGGERKGDFTWNLAGYTLELKGKDTAVWYIYFENTNRLIMCFADFTKGKTGKMIFARIQE